MADGADKEVVSPRVVAMRLLQVRRDHVLHLFLIIKKRAASSPYLARCLIEGGGQGGMLDEQSGAPLLRETPQT